MIRKFICLSLIVCSIFIFISCNNEEKPIKYDITILNNLDNSNEIITIDGTSFSLANLPNQNEKENVFLGYSFNDNSDYLENDILYEINKDITLYANFGISKSFFKINSIADVHIFAEKPITNKTDYVSANIRIENDEYPLTTTSVNIRLRGNSSLVVDKKSYKLKFENKQDIFNMGSDREWALIANYYDPSHLRNYYAYKLALAMQIEYSVECKFVNLYMNNQYQGLYLFCETVKTSTNRVDIEDGFNENDDEIPFLLELDYKLEENNPNYMENLDKDFFLLDNRKYNGKVYQYATKYPKTFTKEHISQNQYQYIKDYMNNVYKSARNGNYEDYIDVDSFIDYFIVQELFMNIDLDYSSVFMYKPYGEKLHMGPLWDFDLSSGNCGYVNNYTPFTQMKDVNGGSYLFNTLMENKEFHDKFINRLKELDKYILPLMIESFDHNYNFINGYTSRDNDKWNTLNESNWARPENLINLTYEEQIKFLKNYLEQHYYWMINFM